MSPLAIVFAASTNPALAESGGSHNQKGVDFQRYWAILRALTLEQEGATDFVLLFESVQDVLELDSEHDPSNARVYQVKKKDAGEWEWKELTALDGPPLLKADGTPRKKRQPKNPDKVPTFVDSPIGKLAACVRALSGIHTTGHFISNAGCAIPLATPPGGSASAAQQCHLGQLEKWYGTSLESSFSSLGEPSLDVLPLSNLYLERTTVHPDAPEDALIGRANLLLTSRSPAHAAQAKTLVQSLFVSVSAKGRHTGQCQTMVDLRKRRGFGRIDLQKSLSALEKVPDLASLRSAWMKKLSDEGFSLVEHTRIEVALSELVRERLSGIASTTDEFQATLAAWILQNPPDTSLRSFLMSGAERLVTQFPTINRIRLYAHLLNEGIKQCVDQASEN